MFKTSELSSSGHFSSTGPSGQTVQWSSQTRCGSPLVTGVSEMRIVKKLLLGVAQYTSIDNHDKNHDY